MPARIIPTSSRVSPLGITVSGESTYLLKIETHIDTLKSLRYLPQKLNAIGFLENCPQIQIKKTFDTQPNNMLVPIIHLFFLDGEFFSSFKSNLDCWSDIEQFYLA